MVEVGPTDRAGQDLAKAAPAYTKIWLLKVDVIFDSMPLLTAPRGQQGLELKMKIRQIADSRNQHIIAVEHNGELRCFFKNSSQHTTQVAFDNLRRDLARHGESVIEFGGLPKITSRTAKSGRTVYDVAE